MVIISIMAMSIAATMMRAGAATGGLVTPGTLSVGGSSTVAPVANDAKATFPAYFNALGLAGAGTISAVTVDSSSSGNAFGQLLQTKTPYTDCGQMSRPPTNAEWQSMQNAQDWAIGVDSVAIVFGSGLTSSTDVPKTALQNLTTLQVGKMFVINTVTNTSNNQPYYTYWDQFDASLPHQLITVVVRDTTSGTYDCFQNFFLTPNGLAGSDKGVKELVPGYVPRQGNGDVYSYMTSPQGQYAVAFISMGYLHLGGLAPANIQNTLDGKYYAPNVYNVLQGLYQPWRWLWEVTQGIPTTGTIEVAKSVWISYLKLPGTYNSTTSYLQYEGYIAMKPGDMAGTAPINDQLIAISPNATQTQTIPDGKVDFSDVTYFVDAYIKFYSLHQLNPMADLDANGVIDFNDVTAFVSAYIAFWTTPH